MSNAYTNPRTDPFQQKLPHTLVRFAALEQPPTYPKGWALLLEATIPKPQNKVIVQDRIPRFEPLEFEREQQSFGNLLDVF